MNAAALPAAAPRRGALQAPAPAGADRAAQVQACLATVMDPELDEPVTTLGFVTEVVLGEDGSVQIAFRLPTYWCAANFAFLMADDMRLAVAALPWVSQVQVQLHEHMYAEAINAGVAQGQGFAASFGEAAAGGLDGLRRTFALKAFQRRQAALVQHLLDAGHAPEALARLALAALPALAPDAQAQALVERHLARRGVPGGGSAAFVDTEGRALDAQGLQAQLVHARRVDINAEFNGALCRGLLAARYGEATPQPIHFVRRRSPAATH